MIAFIISRVRAAHGELTFSATAFLGCLLVTAIAHAEKPDPLSNKKADVMKILRDRTIPADQAELFDDYFKKYFLAQFASSTPSTHDNLNRVRKDLKLYMITGKSGEAHDRLNELTLEKMKGICAGKNFDPTAKYNALLVIGELNEQEGEVGKNAAKPLPKAFPLLLTVFKAKGTKDYMKAAALIGLERFAVSGSIPPASAADFTKALLELVNQKKPPAGRTEAVHDYMRRNAAQILALLGSPGPDNSVVKAFEAIASDDGANPMLRCEMAQFIGQLKYPAAAKIDVQQLANALGHQAVEICKDELESAKAANRAPSRRLIMLALYSATVALEGPDTKSGLVAAAAGTANQKFVDGLRAKFKKLTTSIDNRGSDAADDTLAVELSEQLGDVESSLAPKVSAKKEALVAKQNDKVAEPAKQQDDARATAGPVKAGTR